MEKSFLTTIADVDILWESDCPSEIEKFKDLFFYHHIDKHDEKNILHNVKYVPIWNPVSIKQDMVTKWEGYYVGCFHKENHVNWLYSPSTGEDLLILSDEVWIVHNRKKYSTICYLYCRKTDSDIIERPDISDTFIILLHTIMAMYHRYSIHAAAIEWMGDAYILIGESGHGKSTLCTDMTSRGAEYLGDDVVFLYSEADQLFVGSLLFKAKLFPDGIKNHKIFVDVIKRDKGNVILKAPVKKIFYICRSRKNQSRFERLEPIDTIIRLMRASNNIRLQYDADVWQELCQRIANQVPYFAFHYGKRELVNLNDFRNA